ncbi:fructoselysine-6-P-deglycase FrlB-like protein [Methylobacterium sp. PvP062]|uniref:Fructoselysine-6-P-deglycase FrlB-like protein n=1 Tax=Methylobacterium radiotolerans TaxID=31998 RepID=A0ABV2NMY4_9HYPH|nr:MULTISPECIES: hypothetical protein [unclassified Methylobacterium]MBP2495413.1 fructoselysine-6-P-deglycase FrlB-like protein [Methylobacterium sp. PvP105]MBP2504716.1 fructoselysine-6-P-deglycase FrlB-like protein [Methylobacterium sp. PvP109]MCX7335729.1 hypothetical protein [Hyphomicrobiales bacterium]
MCLLTATDQPHAADAPTLREKADAAYEDLLIAIAARQKLLQDIDDGARSAAFGKGLPDERLKRINKIAQQAEYAYQQAAHAVMLGEPHAGAVTSLSLALAMQIRLGRNDKDARLAAPAERLPATASVGAL